MTAKSKEEKLDMFLKQNLLVWQMHLIMLL